MRRALLVALAAALVAADKPDAKKELDRFQGEWVLASHERDGKKVPEAEAKLLRLAVKGAKYALLRDGKEVGRGGLELDPSKAPRAIDAVSTEGKSKGQRMQGIYAWDGTAVKVCFARPGKPRPTKFTAEAGSGNQLSVWKRAK